MVTRIRIKGAAHAWALLAAVCLVGAALAPTVSAQQAGGAAGRARSEPAKRVMWWNSNDMIVGLKLTAEQRTKMDQVYGWHEAADETPPGRLRQQFYGELKSADWQAAEKALGLWAEAEKASAKRQGDLKIGVLSLLREDQIEVLQTRGGGNLIRAKWRPKMSWPMRGNSQGKPQGNRGAQP
jgi:Spy/CpxP family protein refolding chaperone